MFDAWLNSELFRTIVATGLFFVTCGVLLAVLLAYLHHAKRLSERPVVGSASSKLVKQLRDADPVNDLP